MQSVPRADLPVWRSLLCVPVNVDRFVRKAGECSPDAVVLDLEGSIAPRDKALARALVPEAASIAGAHGADVLVRINRSLDLAVRDIEDVVCQQVDALVLPDVDSVGHVRLLSEFIAQVERAKEVLVGHTRLCCIVESPAGVRDAFAIAAADARVVAFACAAERFVTDCGAAAEPDLLAYSRLRGVIAARAAGVMPLVLFSSTADVRDLSAFRRAVSEARRFGFQGGACVHPAQVPLLDEGFSPTPEERADAESVIRVYEAASGVGRGSTALDGRMVDRRALERARRLLELSGRIDARQASKGQRRVRHPEGR